MSKLFKTVLILSLLGNLTIAFVAYKALSYRAYINVYLDKYTNVVREFSQREVFHQANEALVSDTTVPGRLVFFGTQVTDHWDLNSYFGDYETINRGISAQRVAGFILRFRPDVIELKPEAVIVEISSYNFRPNATIDEIFDYAVSMADLARYHGITPILTTVIPPTSDYVVEEHKDYIVKDSVAVYSAMIRRYAKEQGLPLADFNAVVSNNKGFLIRDLASSQVDLNEAGYKAISQAVSTCLPHRSAAP